MLSLKKITALAVLSMLTGCAVDAPPVPVEPLPQAVSEKSHALPVEWVSFGFNGAMPHYYPHKAWQAQVDGTVYLACGWDAAGRVTNCDVLREAPGDYGFGEATVAMLKDVGRVQSKDKSRPIEPGQGLVIGIRWHGVW